HAGGEAAFELLARKQDGRARGCRTERAARAVGRRVICITYPDGDTLDRYLHCLGGDLGEDRVSTSTYVSHRQFDDELVIWRQPRPRSRTAQFVTAYRWCHPEPYQPAAIADARRLGYALVPAKAYGALT